MGRAGTEAPEVDAYESLRQAVRFYARDPKRFAREANYTAVKALLNERDHLLEAGDRLAEAVQAQIAHGHPVSIVVAQAVRAWKRRPDGLRPEDVRIERTTDA